MKRRLSPAQRLRRQWRDRQYYARNREDPAWMEDKRAIDRISYAKQYGLVEEEEDPVKVERMVYLAFIRLSPGPSLC
jgi:hypothetical protein